MSRIQVAAGIIQNENREILIAQRPPGKHLAGLWEFPGGKLEAGEAGRDAIIRELKEELELDIRIEDELGIFPFTYPWGELDLHVFIVSGLNAPRATEHVQVFKWIEPKNISIPDLAPADVEPFLRYLMEREPGL